MTRQIVMADELGYCWGVRRALDIISEAGNPENPVATIGDVIHNPQVVQRLTANGVHPLLTMDEAVSKGFNRVATTAHGAGPDRAPDAKGRGLELIDTTCPLVTKVQRLGQKLVRQGYYLVVYGDGYHPEVRGILGWADTKRACAAKHIEDLPWTARRGSSDPDAITPPHKVAVVSQTTKMVDEFMKFVTALTEMVARDGGEIRICNTICEPTSNRQNALRKLADESDLILVIGGKKSSNTARLAEVGNSYGVPSYHIESETDIDPSWLSEVEFVGVTAGASTPDDVIQEVVDWLVGQGFNPPEGGIRHQSLDELPNF
ncbi:MAG TPA: 4-hydroxy-3-methylbut-2-enyl diphosphate reductase [Thermomicrobiaceae bacterium]|nr:4-hydroxy-3-methylbut-2-enyl diphosphate reductase [Thermomicrobiaceae bacterium]